MPVPAPSPVRIALAKIAYGFVAVDVVVADLSRDPRSELAYERRSGPAVAKGGDVAPIPSMSHADQRRLRKRGIR